MAKKGQTLSLAQAAVLLGRSERFVGNLRERGYVETPQHGRYPLVGLVRGLISYLDHQIAKQADTARQTAATDARTREIELRIEWKAASLIRLSDVEAELDDWANALGAEMATIEGLEFGDPAQQKNWQEELSASLNRVRKLTTDAKTRLKTE